MKRYLLFLLIWISNIAYSQKLNLPAATSFAKDEAFGPEYHEASPVGKTAEENEVKHNSR